MWAAEMERRDREAARPEGYREAACEACGCALFVPVGQGGEVFCPQCQREGQALAAVTDGDDGDGPRPPASGAMHPDYPYFAALAARMLDDQLCEAIGIAEAQPGGGGAAAGWATGGVGGGGGAGRCGPPCLPRQEVKS